MGFIKNRISKIHGWRSKILNQARKKVLIKAAVRAVPSYVMNVFKLPITWVSEFNAMIADFWWGMSNEGKKIYWRRWDVLGQSKLMGGLGFHEVETFNVVLLTKMVARILKEPNALWVRVIKGLYFPTQTFGRQRRERVS